MIGTIEELIICTLTHEGHGEIYLMEEYGNTPIAGEDTVRIINKLMD